jgi:HEAT repeat protein
MVFSFCAVMLLSGCTGGSSTAISQDPRQSYIDARTTLLRAATDPDAATRAHAIEAMAETLGVEAGSAYMDAMNDSAPMVRYAAALAIGDVRYAPALDTLLKLARNGEPDKRVFCAVIYALYRLGNDEYAGELVKMLFDKEKEVRADAAMAMGRMGEASAIGPLKSLAAQEQDPMVRIQVIESMALLGDEPSTFLLEAYTKTPFLDDRLVAIEAISRTNTRRGVQVIREILYSAKQPPTIRVDAAGAVARMGQPDEEGYELCVEAVQNPQKMLEGIFKGMRKLTPSEVSTLQRLGAMGLGRMKRIEAVSVLQPLLTSADGGVRVAAAMSILKLLEAYRPSMPPSAVPASQPRVLPMRPAAAATSESVASPPPQTSAPTPAPSPVARPKIYSAGGRD